MGMAHTIAEQTYKNHKFKDGRGWYDVFTLRHPNLTLCSCHIAVLYALIPLFL